MIQKAHSAEINKMVTVGSRVPWKRPRYKQLAPMVSAGEEATQRGRVAEEYVILHNLQGLRHSRICIGVLLTELINYWGLLSGTSPEQREEREQGRGTRCMSLRHQELLWERVPWFSKRQKGDAPQHQSHWPKGGTFLSRGVYVLLLT